MLFVQIAPRHPSSSANVDMLMRRTPPGSSPDPRLLPLTLWVLRRGSPRVPTEWELVPGGPTSHSGLVDSWLLDSTVGRIPATRCQQPHRRGPLVASVSAAGRVPRSAGPSLWSAGQVSTRFSWSVSLRDGCRAVTHCKASECLMLGRRLPVCTCTLTGGVARGHPHLLVLSWVRCPKEVRRPDSPACPRKVPARASGSRLSEG